MYCKAELKAILRHSLIFLSLPLYLIYHRHKPTSSRCKEIECNEISIRLGLVYACVYACVRVVLQML